MANNMILKMIRQESKDLKISMKRLCYGICSSAYLSKCINEDLEMDKLMLEALLQRLGISTRRYTFVLRDSEYACFECREKARKHIWQGEYQKAEECLEQYIQIQTELKSAKHLHSQATALLRSYIIADKQNSFAEQLRNVEEGLAATNAKLEEVDFVTNSYSEIELLLILRGAMIWSHMGQTEKAIKLYKQFYQLQKTVPYTTNEFEHIFAKVNYEMAKYYLSQKEYKKVMEIAADSIKLLAESNKFLFMWELMEMYLKAEENAPEVERLAENRDVFDNYTALKSVVGRYYKNWNADEHCPMYYEYEIYSLRKMISQRRKLMGETQESISRKINCDYATIERLERGLHDTQTGIRYALLNEIGLPIEKCYYMLIADNMQVRRDYFNYMAEIARGNIDEAKKLLEKVENSLDMSVVINKQAIDIQKIGDEKSKDEKKMREYQEKVTNILCETLPESYLESPEGGLLYGNEENILRRIIMNYERREDLKSASELTIRVLNGYQKPQVVDDEFVGVYLGFSLILESMSANMGDFEGADKLVKNNLGKCVRHDMAGLLTFWLYDAFWNKEKQKKRLTKQDFNLLDVAMTIAAVQNNEVRKKFICRYRERITANKDANTVMND